MAHLTNFSFWIFFFLKFSHKMPFYFSLYHGVKNVKIDQKLKSRREGSCLNQVTFFLGCFMAKGTFHDQFPLCLPVSVIGDSVQLNGGPVTVVTDFDCCENLPLFHTCQPSHFLQDNLLNAFEKVEVVQMSRNNFPEFPAGHPSRFRHLEVSILEHENARNLFLAVQSRISPRRKIRLERYCT